MLVQEALFKLLSTNQDIIDVIDDRIYPVVLDTDVIYPAIAYRQVGGDHDSTLLGSSGRKRMRFRIFSTDRNTASGYVVATRLAEVVRLTLQDFRGEVFSDEDPSSIFIQDISPVGAHDMYDDPTKTFQVVEDYDITAHEVQPEHI